MILHVYGHPRSGNHYMSALIRANNLGPKAKRLTGGRASVHRWPPPFPGEPFGKLFGSDDNRFIYIWRNWNDVALSNLYKEKPRRIDPGLSLNDFSSTPWNELVKNGSIQAQLLSRWVMDEQRHMTPYESWTEHVGKWLDFADHRVGVHAVRYESLLNNFQSTMSGIAVWLEVDRDGDFENITKKVDPAGVRPGGFRGE
jgi:hypothetical protein